LRGATTRTAETRRRCTLDFCAHLATGTGVTGSTLATGTSSRGRCRGRCRGRSHKGPAPRALPGTSSRDCAPVIPVPNGPVVRVGQVCLDFGGSISTLATLPFAVPRDVGPRAHPRATATGVPSDAAGVISVSDFVQKPSWSRCSTGLGSRMALKPSFSKKGPFRQVCLCGFRPSKRVRDVATERKSPKSWNSPPSGNAWPSPPEEQAPRGNITLKHLTHLSRSEVATSKRDGVSRDGKARRRVRGDGPLVRRSLVRDGPCQRRPIPKLPKRRSRGQGTLRAPSSWPLARPLARGAPSSQNPELRGHGHSVLGNGPNHRVKGTQARRDPSQTRVAGAQVLGACHGGFVTGTVATGTWGPSSQGRCHKDLVTGSLEPRHAGFVQRVRLTWLLPWTSHGGLSSHGPKWVLAKTLFLGRWHSRPLHSRHFSHDLWQDRCIRTRAVVPTAQDRCMKDLPSDGPKPREGQSRTSDKEVGTLYP